MAANLRDLFSLSVEELQREYVRYVHLLESEDHVGRQNRISRGQWRVLEELKSRSDGTLRLLLPLRAHADVAVQLSASILCKSLDLDGYRERMETLVKRGGAIGKRAQESLTWDEWFKAHPPGPPTPVSRSPDFEWLSASKVPVGITHAELEQHVRSEFLPDFAEPIISLAKATIGIWPRQLHKGSDPRTSRLGGMPLVPGDWSWPTLDDEPMLFVGQINCAEIAALPSGRFFPRTGLISFFGDFDCLNGCTGGCEEGGAVFYWADTESLVPAKTPVDDFMPLRSCAVGFYETLSLPDPLSHEIERLPFDRDQRKRYSALHEAVRRHGTQNSRFHDFHTSKLLGWPDLVQNDFLPDPDRERLLFQVGSYDDGTESQDWGSGGLVYFAISEQNLVDLRFDRVMFEMQCT